MVLLLSLWVMLGPLALARDTEKKGTPLPPSALKALRALGWDEKVGSKRGLWVHATHQTVYLIDNYCVVRQYRCATGAAGLGNQQDSGKTPLGWHRVGAKIGDGLPVGAILKARKWTKKTWRPGQKTSDDLVLSRILWLRGLEPGKNLGGKVDSWNRYIYIHGTNHVNTLGSPSSHGCVRLDPREMIDLYDRVEKNTRVLITGPEPKP
jgi:hypothetical protein